MPYRSLFGLIASITFLVADVAAAAPNTATTDEGIATQTVTVTTISEPAPTTLVSQPQPQPPPIERATSKRGLGLMITGWSLLTASYALTALSGAIVIDTCSTSDTYDCRKLGRSLMVPVIGPFLATSQIDTMRGRLALAVFPGLSQVAGLSMGIAGSVLFSRSRRHRMAALNADGLRLTRRAQHLRLSNTASPYGGGIRLTYRF
ncbi:MAG TPA: hypothetical protein ENJ18_11315 [Nannocystis exedens]|nr:hypothetical protein [Nannocystis exedens]